jgi:hypothetical protein
MFMIMVGGYMYMTSAGNSASTGKAKGIITDALIGLILALCSWILLNTINPDLNIIKLPESGTTGSANLPNYLKGQSLKDDDPYKTKNYTDNMKEGGEDIVINTKPAS